MINLRHIDELARRLTSLVPESLSGSGAELQEHFKATLKAGLGRLDLVTREEFDVQRAVLLRTREKLDALQRQLDGIENRSVPGATAPPPATATYTSH